EAQLVQAPSSMTPAAAPHTAAATDATEAAHETGLAHDRMTPKKRASRPKYEPGSPALPSSGSCSPPPRAREALPGEAAYEQWYEPAPPPPGCPAFPFQGYVNHRASWGCASAALWRAWSAARRRVARAQPASTRT